MVRVRAWVMFGLIKLKKNEVWGGLIKMISEWKTGVGVDFLFEVGLFTVMRRNVEDIMVGGGIGEGREGNVGRGGFVFGNGLILVGRDGRVEELIVLSNGRIG